MPVLCFLGVGLTSSEQTLELLTDGTCFVLVSGEESPSHGQSPHGDRHQSAGSGGEQDLCFKTTLLLQTQTHM